MVDSFTHCLLQVKVVSVEEVQGQGHRVVIISTVRTSASELDAEKEADFLINPKV